MCLDSPYRLGCACVLLWFSATALHAQDPQPAPSKETPELPAIADEPKTIDPAAFMPAKLAAKVTVDFSDSSLREVLTWLQEKQGLVVLLENDALSDVGVLPGDPVSDRLDETPIYLFLNRLRSLGIAWYFEDDILHVTSQQVVGERLTTMPYNIGDLIDAGYDLDTLGELIVSTIDPSSWAETGGSGVVSFLGDVIFVHQTDNVQHEVHGLLAALRNHGRQTFLLDPPQHCLLRQKLGENVTVAFRETPLEKAVEQLAQKAQIDIRLDMTVLRKTGIRQRRPITLSLTDRKLKTVLQAMLIDLELTWILRDGVLWLTTDAEAETFCKTAVYDVRDLCQDQAESEALVEAITSQARATSWDDVGGPGSAHVARPGTLVISNTESVLGDVLDLLETYRTALRSSKSRQRPEDDPNRIVTVYYRMHTDIANDLLTLLPRLVRPESWKITGKPEAAGEIILVHSAPDLSNIGAATAMGFEAEQPTRTLVIARSVLIIRQTRATHDEIEEVIQRVESGDPKEPSEPFVISVIPVTGSSGGGFFSVSPDNALEDPK
ncbi:MAG: hypothetical protein HQ567_29265 [Candidatus Nealsonbacteria bacterium]|nr:hypothetical protein [Candidatus Nealsonbacteria bacterium]